MKFASTLIAAALSFVALNATAQNQPGSSGQEILACSVPVQNAASEVSMTVTLMGDLSADFVLFNVNDKGTTFRLFTQTTKGTVANGLSQGSLAFLVLEENFASDAGVIRNSGFLALNKKDDGTFGGLLSARGNIYPLSCQTR